MPLPIAIVLLGSSQALAPNLLVVGLAPEKKDGPVTSPLLGMTLGQQFYEDGRVTPIVWSLTDPTFRVAALDGKLGRDVPDAPTKPLAMDVARKFNADYVLLFRTERKDGKLDATGELLIRGRSVWKDRRAMNAELNGQQSDVDTAASIARTWVLVLSTGPLKDLTPRKVVETPTAQTGQTPVVVEPTPTPPTVNRVEELQTRVASLMADGKPGAARALVRDAVDIDPLSAELRLVYVRLLATQGDTSAAADEALRAADLLSESSELRVRAVRLLLASGRTKEAKNQLNEFRARNADEKLGHRLAAEVALADLDAETAIREIEPLLRAGEDVEARLLRGLARACLGGQDGAVADLTAWSSATTNEAARADSYRLAESIIGAAADRAITNGPDLLRRAAVQPKSAAVRDELDAFQRQAKARDAAWAVLKPTVTTTTTHNNWALAHRLVILVAADLRDYIAGNAEALTAARIDLGEARRAMKVARGR